MNKIKSIYKKSGRWYYVYRLPGSREQKWHPLKSLSEREAREEAAIFKLELLKRKREHRFGEPARPRDIEWAGIVQIYMDLCRAERNAESTLERKRLHFKHIDRIMNIQMTSEWNGEAFDTFKMRCERDKAAAGVVNKELFYIKAVLSLARRRGFISMSADDLEDVKMVADNQPKPVEYGPEEAAQIIRVASPFWRMTVLLVSMTGMRRTELLNLRWKDVHFDEDYLVIADRLEWRSKTRRSLAVPLHPDLREALRAWSRVSDDGEMVLPWHTTPTEFSKAFKRLLKKAGLSGGSLKSFRHGVVSELVDTNLNSRKVSRFVGHVRPSTTDKYGGLKSKAMQEVVAHLPRPLAFIPELSNQPSNLFELINR